MSKNNRRLSYWTVNFINQQGEQSFDDSLFIDFLQYVINLDSKRLLINDRRNYRAEALKNLKLEKVDSFTICKMVMKSCKYNHSPDLMSSEDGTERPSNKTLSEGDEELTHLCIRVDSKEANIVYEQRVSGMSFSRFIAYLNRFFKAYIRDKDINTSKENINTIIVNPRII